MNTKTQARLNWVKMYIETNDAGLVCRRCGISRPTLRKWVNRYKTHGLQGLEDMSKKPYNMPNKKLDDVHIQLILELRNKRNLGVRRIQTELLRLYNYSLSLSTIHKILVKNNVKPIKKLKRQKKFKRYQRPIPGDRIQLDTCKIAPGIYQYTAVDDCSRWRALQIYSRRTAKNTLDFIELMIERFPFPIQRIQTDRGNEFFAVKVQERLMEYGIKFRPIKPASPHLNGKVERSQRTDLEEFYATADLTNFEQLREYLECWTFFYNWQRPHSSLNGKNSLIPTSELRQIVRHQLASLCTRYAIGNCEELATLAFLKILGLEYKGNVELVYFKFDTSRLDFQLLEPPSHVFVVINRDAITSILEPSKWNETTFIIDPWIQKVYNPSEFETIWKNNPWNVHVSNLKCGLQFNNIQFQGF